MGKGDAMDRELERLNQTYDLEMSPSQNEIDFMPFGAVVEMDGHLWVVYEFYKGYADLLRYKFPDERDENDIEYGITSFRDHVILDEERRGVEEKSYRVRWDLMSDMDPRQKNFDVSPKAENKSSHIRAAAQMMLLGYWHRATFRPELAKADFKMYSQYIDMADLCLKASRVKKRARRLLNKAGKD